MTAHSAIAVHRTTTAVQQTTTALRRRAAKLAGVNVILYRPLLPLHPKFLRTGSVVMTTAQQRVRVRSMEIAAGKLPNIVV